MSLNSLIASGSKLWLDSVDPQLVQENFAAGATGATSNPAIISGLIKTGRFDQQMEALMRKGEDDESIAWSLADQLVSSAQQVFQPVWEATQGDDGYVSFELNPLIEDPQLGLSHDERVRQYIELGKKWSAGHTNRMIKVPATPAGLASLAELSAAGVTLNVTLIFSEQQCQAAREAVWKGAQQRATLDQFKSVFSVFVSRIDVYTQQHVPSLSPSAQGIVGIVNAKRIWQSNVDYWSSKQTPLAQEMIFASTGTKSPSEIPWRYVEAFAGADIETNPPATNEAADKSGVTFTRQVDEMPPASLLAEIDEKVDFSHMETTLMEEGILKFAEPQKALLALIAEKRNTLIPA